MEEDTWGQILTFPQLEAQRCEFSEVGVFLKPTYEVGIMTPRGIFVKIKNHLQSVLQFQEAILTLQKLNRCDANDTQC